MTSAPLRIGMIGAGKKAGGHATQIGKLSQLARLTGVADVARDRAEQIASPHGAKAHEDFRALFDNSDVILVVSPNHLHFEQTIAAAKAGKHVFCEKPLSLSVAQTEEMVQVCREAGVKLGTGVAGRFGFVGAELLRLIHEHELGEPLGYWDRRLDFIPPNQSAPWRNDPAKSGGVLYEYLSHEVDWLRKAGGKVRRVFGRKACRWSPPGYFSNDHVWATFEYESGLTGTMEGSICAHSAEYSKGFTATKGTAFSRAIPGKGHTLFVQREGSAAVEVPSRTGFRGPLESYLDAVARGEEPPATGHDGMAITAISDAILRSAETGLSVEIPERQR